MSGTKALPHHRGLPLRGVTPGASPLRGSMPVLSARPTRPRGAEFVPPPPARPAYVDADERELELPRGTEDETAAHEGKQESEEEGTWMGLMYSTVPMVVPVMLLLLLWLWPEQRGTLVVASCVVLLAFRWHLEQQAMAEVAEEERVPKEQRPGSYDESREADGSAMDAEEAESALSAERAELLMTSPMRPKSPYVSTLGSGMDTEGWQTPASHQEVDVLMQDGQQQQERVRVSLKDRALVVDGSLELFEHGSMESLMDWDGSEGDTQAALDRDAEDSRETMDDGKENAGAHVAARRRDRGPANKSSPIPSMRSSEWEARQRLARTIRQRVMAESGLASLSPFRDGVEAQTTMQESMQSKQMAYLAERSRVLVDRTAHVQKEIEREQAAMAKEQEAVFNKVEQTKTAYQAQLKRLSAFMEELRKEHEREMAEKERERKEREALEARKQAADKARQEQASKMKHLLEEANTKWKTPTDASCSRLAYAQYTEVRTHAKERLELATQLLDANTKKQLSLKAKKPVSQINAEEGSAKMKAEQVVADLEELLAEEKTAEYYWYMDKAAHWYIKTGSEKAQVNIASAGPFGNSMAHVCKLHEEFAIFALSKFHAKCMYTVPMIKQPDASRLEEEGYAAEYFKSIGYTKNSNGQLEDEESWQNRMTGIMRLYGVFLQSGELSGVQKVNHGTLWQWVAGYLNLDIVNGHMVVMLADMLQVAYPRMHKTYKTQWTKVVQLVVTDIIPWVEHKLQNQTGHFDPRNADMGLNNIRTHVIEQVKQKIMPSVPNLNAL